MKTNIKRMSGCVATANAVKLANVDVICSYPIRPYTGIMSELARMVADGELDAEFVLGEGEHGQLSVVYGASAAGARAFTGSSGVGVTYAMEVYSPISGERLPLQMAIADRTLDPPGDFGSEQTDAMCCRDQGWIQGWASTPQEALDMTLMYYRIGEDPRVLLPQYACQDGYFVSHILGEVDVPSQEQVNSFLPPYKNHHVLDTRNPQILGAQMEPEMGPGTQYQRHLAVEGTYKVIEEVHDEFGKTFGRKYDPWLEEYMTDDAEIVIFMQGGHTETAKNVAMHLRNLGEKVGVVRLRTLRPFPTKQVRECLKRFKVVGVVDNSVNFGISCGAGVLLTEARAALYNNDEKVKTVGFVAGLGGSMITHDEFYKMFNILKEVNKTGKIEKQSYWAPFEL
ncbi:MULTISPECIES: oxalate oxidoreductase subunit alpha [Clostridium]|uniref:NADH-dependent phenylglyoxylate dehydrogenase subunit alpha n=1 Tax=Clostridium ragsdalei P11 TaxID=1353534 RepID=A0A1A6AM12_9CLOT|nr:MULTISPECIES: transketolase C-terminal domain-containing protein [Clostridium]OBR91081.1 NADH-dependent phenylglyoxylate dehydrogenase subunit alpha [Clostridium ragsdalei P11]QXE17431.1 pyruvate ferredoxin oxidoreductase [Clostridium sp. 001]QXE18440.1 pyruvate ferredoxin oxidoreductase [Clostridium sp. 001]